MGIRFFLHATPDLSKMVKFRRWAMAALSFFLSFLPSFFGEKKERKKKTLGHYEGGIMEMVVKEAFWGMRYDRNDGIEGVR